MAEDENLRSQKRDYFLERAGGRGDLSISSVRDSPKASTRDVHQEDGEHNLEAGDGIPGCTETKEPAERIRKMVEV